MSSPADETVAPAVNKPGPFDPLLLARGLAGAIVGGLVGYFAFRWLSKQGFYGPMLPGALLGIGAGWAVRGRSQLLGVVCGLAGLFLGVFSEWMRSPSWMIPASRSSWRICDMQGANVKLLMIALGGAAAYWFGQGR